MIENHIVNPLPRKRVREPVLTSQIHGFNCRKLFRNSNYVHADKATAVEFQQNKNIAGLGPQGKWPQKAWQWDEIEGWEVVGCTSMY
jgi:hypothetical protein